MSWTRCNNCGDVTEDRGTIEDYGLPSDWCYGCGDIENFTELEGPPEEEEDDD